jgi:hypothetical protein
VQATSNLANRLSVFGVINVWERERYSQKWGTYIWSDSSLIFRQRLYYCLYVKLAMVTML